MKGSPNFCRGPRLTCQVFLNYPHCVFWSWRVSRCVFCENFVAGREEVCRIRRDPFLKRQGSLHFLHESPGPWPVSRCVFCKNFVAGRKEMCTVPTIFAGVPASRVRFFPFSICVFWFWHVSRCVCVFASISLPVIGSV